VSDVNLDRGALGSAILGAVHRFPRHQLVVLLTSVLVATLAACAGKSKSDKEGSAAGGSAGVGMAGESGSSTGGTGGAAGAPICERAPVGILCVRGTPDGENERIAVGDPLRIDVMPSGCYSSSCTDVVVETCSVAGGAPDFTASAELCHASNADPNVGCTTDCGGGGYAQCESEQPLAPGDYTVTLGELSVSFTVPGTLSIGAACDGSPF
jgi:hypothetical protein